MVEISGIKVASRGPMTDGVFKVAAGGLIWKKAGGGRHIDIPPADISSMRWTKIGKYCQLCVKRHQHPSITFTGFRDQDLESLADVCKELLRVKIEEKHMAAHGRNWGDALIEGTQLDFVSADSKLCFAVNLSDVIQAQLSGNKNDVQLSFQTDDTGGRGIDSLCEMAIYVPADHPEYAAAGEDEENVNASKAFLETVLQKTDAGAVTSADAIVTFSEVAVLAPRGRFDVEMHASFLKLYGQSQEFRVAFASISRLFILPKTQQPHTLVAISLDPPIRKGQTFYNHILCQFPTDEEVEVNLDISDELLESKNEQCGKKLHRDFQGSSADVFSRVLRGLAAAKITRPGNFRAADDTALAIKCSYKADLGHLYPLEKAFFYINKPPLLITHEEIEGVEFQRQGNDSLAVAKTFDLLFRLKNDQEHQFRNIQRNEWANLFEWMQAKNLRIENLAEAQQGPGGPGRALQLDDGGASDDDEDFAMGSGEDDDGEPSDEDSDDSGSDMASADMSGDEGGEPEAKSKPKAKASKPKEKARKSDEKDEKAPPKKRAKKDKNAPKKGMSAFMMFSNDVRDTVRSENPDATFGDMGKIIGARWKAMEAGDKTKYDEMAATDKARFEREMADYKEKLAAAE